MAKRKRCTQCGYQRADKFFRTPRARVCITCQRKTKRRTTKDRRLRETYGISHADYDKLLDRQGGACAICGGVRAVLSVDHCHAREKAGAAPRSTVRGLLCRRCNGRLLTAALDNPAILRRAADYLEDPPAFHVL